MEKLIRFFFETPRWSKRKGFVLQIVLGSGAGRIHGRTIFIAYNSGSLQWARKFANGHINSIHSFIDYTRIGNFEVGFTQNANVVPYAGE